MWDKGTKTVHVNQFTPLFANRPTPAVDLHILPSAQYSIFWGEVRDTDGVQASVLEKRGALQYSAHDTSKGAQQVQSRHCENQLF